MTETAQLSLEAIRQIQEMYDWYLAQKSKTGRTGRVLPPHAGNLPAGYFVLTTSIITAMAGDTLGSGTGDICRADVNGKLTAVTGLTGKKIWNVGGEVASGIYVKTSPDQYGTWSVDVAKCS